MSKRSPRSGRRERNNPVCPRQVLLDALAGVVKEHGVMFPGSGNFENSCLALYKAMMLAAPAVVITTGLPVSVYGVGSCRVSGNRLRFRYSDRISRMTVPYLCLEGFGKSFARVFQDLKGRGKQDVSVIETVGRLSLGIEEG